MASAIRSSGRARSKSLRRRGGIHFTSARDNPSAKVIHHASARRNSLRLLDGVADKIDLTNFQLIWFS